VITIPNSTLGPRHLRAAVVFLLVVLSGQPLLAQTPSLPDRLPANTLFYAHWRGMGSVTSAEKTNHVVQLFEDPQFALGRDVLLKSLRNNIAKNGPATSEPELAEVLSLLDNPAVIGVALNPAKAKAPSSDAPVSPVGFFIVYDARGKTGLVERLRAANRATGKEVPTVMTYDFKGTKIEARATDTDVSYTALTPKFYFLADQKPVIEELITRFGVAEKSADSVTDVPEYRSIRSFTGPDAAIEIFARVPDLAKALSQEQLQKPGAKLAVNLHLDRVHALCASVSFAGEAARFRGAAIGDASSGTLFDFAGTSSASFVTQPAVGSGPIFSISRLNLAAIYQYVRAAAAPSMTPEQTANVDMYEKMAQGLLGMPVTEALQLFTGEFASKTSFADDGTALKTFAVSIQKPKDLLRILHTLGGGFIVNEETSGDTTYLDLSYPSPDSKTGEKRRDSYYIAVTPNMLLAAPHKNALRATVSRVDRKPDDEASAGILANPAFARTRSLFPEKLSGLTAVDIVQIPWDKILARYAQQLADAAKNSTTTNPPPTDWLKTVQPEVITRHVHLGISAWWKDSSGIYFDSYVQ
jgi:hypothetical protein